LSPKIYHNRNLEVDTWVSDVISALLLANFEFLMQNLPVFSMCTQDGNCSYITPSTVDGKSLLQMGNFRSVFGEATVGEGLVYSGFCACSGNFVFLITSKNCEFLIII
jgi:hypothetical protein